ncbi:MAG: hypothetical protein IT581_11425 [Verrucomicrobiales bacterium]|nr:hypothetical protein [Verrucomicrobiales bacterium]
MAEPKPIDGADLFGRVCLDYEERYDFGGLAPIARGGQAEIYRVYDRFLKREIALKLLITSGVHGVHARTRFFSEAQITAQLQHPGFLPILDSGLDPFGRPFYTTYLLPGRTFQDVIESVRGHESRKTDPAEFRRAVEIFERIVLIVAYAHSREVFHRDLKPNNVLLGHFDEVYLIDMGAAFVAWASTEIGLESSPGADRRAEPIETDRSPGVAREELDTRDSGRPWHPLYSPPEMVRGEIPHDQRTADIYALGVMLHELCSGCRPYANEDRTLPELDELIRRIRQGPPAPPRIRSSRIPRDLWAVASKAMSYSPEKRYSTVVDLAADLRAFLETRVVQAGDHGSWARGIKWVQRNALPVAAVAILFAVLAFAAVLARNFKVKRDAALQLSHLRDAQLAARSGQWSDALEHLASAEHAGYRDAVDLGLQRYGAYIALSRSGDASNILAHLEGLPRLGDRRGEVLLRRAEFELFAPDTADQGVDHVREALALSLGPADQSFGRGLIATNTSQALEYFHKALEADPYHHGAHRQSLGLEFILARNDRLASHISTLRILYPADPSPVFLNGCRLALEGRLDEAEAVAERIKGEVPAELWERYAGGLRMMSEVFHAMDSGSRVPGSRQPGMTNNPMIQNALQFFAGGGASGSGDSNSPVRLPQLPCVKAGLEKGMRALIGAMMSSADRGDLAIKLVDEALSIHPEGLIALAAASIRESKRPVEPELQIPFLRAQQTLLRSASEFPSVLPPVPAVARLLSLLVARDLRTLESSESSESREHRRALFEWFVAHPRPAGAFNRQLFGISRELEEWDFARIFMGRWESSGEERSEALKARVELEIGTGAYPAALEKLTQVLADDPENPWALNMKQKAQTKLESFNRGVGAMPR